MTRTVPISDATQFFPGSEPATIGREPDPIERYPLADAEEEQFAELWAADPGNQGS